MFFFAPKLTEGKCPVCGEDLYVGEIICDNCHAHYPVEEAILPVAGLAKAHDTTPYSKLTVDELNFLREFLELYGNFAKLAEKHVGEYGKKSAYLGVRKRYAGIINKLGFGANTRAQVDLSDYSDADYSGNKPSEIVMKKLVEAGGRVEIPLFGNKTCIIEASKCDSDGDKCFICDKLNNYKYPYKFTAFDIIVDILKKNGGKMAKGNGRAKVGEDGCTDDTIIGCFAKEYFRKKDGKYAYDPIFVLAAVLDWADIARNQHGYVELI